MLLDILRSIFIFTAHQVPRSDRGNKALQSTVMPDLACTRRGSLDAWPCGMRGVRGHRWDTDQVVSGVVWKWGARVVNKQRGCPDCLVSVWRGWIGQKGVIHTGRWFLVEICCGLRNACVFVWSVRYCGVCGPLDITPKSFWGLRRYGIFIMFTLTVKAWIWLFSSGLIKGVHTIFSIFCINESDMAFFLVAGFLMWP